MKLTNANLIDRRYVESSYLADTLRWMLIILSAIACLSFAKSIKFLDPQTPVDPSLKTISPSLVYASEPDEPHEIMALIRRKGRENGIDDYKITRFIQVAKCESGLNPKSKNKHSSATGLYQILIGTWEDNDCYGSRKNAEDNINCAYKLLIKKGFQPWAESAKCWNK